MFPATASFSKVLQGFTLSSLRKNAFYSEKHNLRKPILQTSNPQSLTRLSQAERRKEGEINGTLNPFKPRRETRGSSLFSSGDAADPDESKDLRRPSALETHMDWNLNDSFFKQAYGKACECAQFKVFRLMSLQV